MLRFSIDKETTNVEVSQKSTVSNTTHSIHLIATDLDGTLLRPDGSVSPRTIAALQCVREAGIAVVLVSARPPRVMRQIAQAAGIGGLALCCNGALLYDLDEDIILQSTTMLPTQTAWLINTLRAAMPDLHFAIEDGLSVTCEPGYYANFTHANKENLRVSHSLSAHSEPVIKLMARHLTSTPEELHSSMLSLVGIAYSVTYSGGPYLEIARASVNKAAALAQLCTQLEISADEVIAFGDMPNDIPMLCWAGRGIAVANAHPLVLEAVREITRSNAEDGVALVLEQLLAHLPESEPTAVQTTWQHPTF